MTSQTAQTQPHGLSSAGHGTGYGSWAADHLSPAYPERAAWGTAQPLRAWQQEALEQYFRTEPRDFLAVIGAAFDAGAAE